MEAAILTAAVFGLLFFTAADFKHGRELWVSDGTLAGTHIVRDLTPGENNTAIRNLCAVPGGVVFTVQFGEVGASHLFVSDGTFAGTKSIDAWTGEISIEQLFRSGKYLYFCCGASPTYSLWYTDGTHSGTRVVTDSTVEHSGFGNSYFLSYKGKH